MSTDPTPQESLRRRLKAARALAGLHVEQLAERIDQQGYGAKTLYLMEGDTGREILPKDFGVLADACGLPREFFTADFAHLGHDHGLTADDAKVVAEVQANQARMAEQMREMRAELVTLAAARLQNATDLEELRSTRRRKGPGVEAR